MKNSNFACPIEIRSVLYGVISTPSGSVTKNISGQMRSPTHQEAECPPILSHRQLDPSQIGFREHWGGDEEAWYYRSNFVKFKHCTLVASKTFWVFQFRHGVRKILLFFCVIGAHFPWLLRWNIRRYCCHWRWVVFSFGTFSHNQ